MLRKKFFLLILSIFITITVSGCWDYTEYENMAQVISSGVDYNKETNEMTVTMQYIPSSRTSKGSGTESSGSVSMKNGIVNSVTDKTFYGAITKLQQVIMKKLFYGYQKVFVIGEDAAKYKMLDLIEFFDRTPSVRTTVDIVITSGKAEKVLSIDDPSGIVSIGDQLYEQINATGPTGTAYPVTMQDFSAMLAIGGLEATAPRVISTVEKSQGPIAEGGTSGNTRFDDKMKGDLMISGTAAFKEDKLVGWLNDKESMGFGWITGKKMLAYKVSETSEDGNSEDILYFRINKSKSKIKVDLINNMPVIHVNIKTTADLRKYYSKKGSEFFTPKEMERVEKKLSDSIQSDVEAALGKGQKQLESDIFGFGFEFFRKYPSLWKTKYEKEWPDIFPDIPVYVNVDSKIINTGTTIKKFILK
jgi:spore germination protein KC